MDADAQTITVAFEDVEGVDGHRAWRDLHRLALADELVCTLPVDLDGADGTRPLHDVAGQRADLAGDVLVGDTAGIGRVCDLTVGILRRRFYSKANRRLVRLRLCNKVRQKLGAPLHPDDEQACGHRIQCSCMADLLRAKIAPDDPNHRVRGHARRLIHQHKATKFAHVRHTPKIYGSTIGTTLVGVNIWPGLDAFPHDIGKTVVTIGVFDGVHRGHQKLICRAVEKAHELGLPCVMITFDPHPLAVIRPQAMPPLLGNVNQRARRANELGVDHIVALQFDRELSSLEPEDFFVHVLQEKINAAAVLVGENFTFGHRAAGTTATLKELGEKHNVEVEVVDLLTEHGERICSTMIRDALSKGDIKKANWALGRPFTVRSLVVRGAGRGGAELGYPTANMYFGPEVAIPADGVYAGFFTVLGEASSTAPIKGTMELGVRYPTAVSVGSNPTFGDERRSVESFVLDEHADLYGRYCRVEFIDFIRGMEKFDSVDELLVAMGRDVEKAREILANTEKPVEHLKEINP